jgi:predicted MFS family arabinose efflux permease
MYFLKGMFFVFLVGLVFFQLFSIVPVYYKQELLFSEFTIGWVLALNGLLIALFEMILVYKLEKQNKSLHYITSGCFLIGISFIVLNIPGTLPIVLISMIIISFGEMFLFPFLNNFWINRSTPSNRGQYAAVYTIAFALAHVLAPTIASQIAMRFGFSTLWLMNFFLCCIASAGFIFLLKQQKAHE